MGAMRLYQLEVTEYELQMIHDVFRELEEESLEKWTHLIPKNGEYRSTECFKSWLETGMFKAVCDRTAAALGYRELAGEEEAECKLQDSAYIVYDHIDC